MIAGYVGIAGEARVVVSDSDGSVRIDTGFQRNIILNQGLDFFGGDSGGAINTSCVIGSGNSTPVATQTKLDSFIAISNGTDKVENVSYEDLGDNTYRMWEQMKYRYTGLKDVNISEVGLASKGGSSDYFLTTRVLVKDSSGIPTSISVRTGETLDIFYKFHKIVSTADSEFTINMLDGNGGSIPYKALVRPINVGGWSRITKGISINSVVDTLSVTTNEPSNFLNSPNATISGLQLLSLSSYTVGSYKRRVNLNFKLGDGNINIRTIFFRGFDLAMFPYQIRFGSVEDDSPIKKTNKEVLTIPVEYSWGRYEGEL